MLSCSSSSRKTVPRGSKPSCKSPESKYFRLPGPDSPYCSYSTLLLHETVIDNWVWLCFNKTYLQRQKEDRIWLMDCSLLTLSTYVWWVWRDKLDMQNPILPLPSVRSELPSGNVSSGGLAQWEVWLWSLASGSPAALRGKPGPQTWPLSDSSKCYFNIHLLTP